MKKTSLLAAGTAAMLVLLLAGDARAQDADAPKMEVGVHFTALEVNPPDTEGTQTRPGVGGRFTFNLNDHVALEAEANFFPRREFDGRTTQAQFGVKAGRRFRRFGVFAKARPGFVSFSEAFTITGTRTETFGGQTFVVPDFDFRRQTHFSVDVGGVIEFYPSRRVVTRFDAGDTIIRYGPRNDFGFSPSAPVVRRPSDVRHNFQLSAGVGYRFGGAGGDDDDAGGGASDERRVPRFEAGVQYTALNVSPPSDIPTPPVVSPFNRPTFTEPAVGGRFTFNLSDSVALEAATDFFTKDNVSDVTFGGRGILGEFGVKAGKRFRRFGVFAKARPGFLTYGNVIKLVGTETFSFGGRQFEVGVFDFGRKTYFAADLGGVVEFYPSRRVVTRFDLGDTIVRYRDRFTQGFLVGVGVIRLPDETRHNFQFTAGLGFRF